MSDDHRIVTCRNCGIVIDEAPRVGIYSGERLPCPNCGSFMYPQRWSQGWGVVLLMIGLTTGLIVAVAMW